MWNNPRQFNLSLISSRYSVHYQTISFTIQEQNRESFYKALSGFLISCEVSNAVVRWTHEVEESGEIVRGSLQVGSSQELLVEIQSKMVELIKLAPNPTSFMSQSGWPEAAQLKMPNGDPLTFDHGRPVH